MAFNPLAGLASAYATHYLSNSSKIKLGQSSVIEFGNQRFRLTKPIVRKISKLLDCSFTIPDSDPAFSDFTPSFFRMMGYKDYYALDMNEKMEAIPVDLNSDLRTVYRFRKQCSLVIDNGTGEHVFDQHMVFKNQHDLCQVGGIILNVKPFFPWINHGFYTFHPVLFRDLAFANGYEEVFTWLGGNHGEYVDVTGDDRIWYEVPRSFPFWKRPKDYLETLIYDQLLPKNNITLVVAYKKLSDAEFKVPLQGKWIGNISDKSIVNRYENQPDTLAKYHS